MLLVIILIGVTKIITIPLSHIQKKQANAKKERDSKIKELQVSTNGDKDALTEEIYKYYKEIDYNPIKQFISKFIVFILNFAILFSLLGAFQPITNFSNLNKNTIQTIVDTYKGNFISNSYLEIEILNNLEELQPYLSDKVSYEEFDELKKVRNKFTIGKVDTTIIPLQSNNNVYIALPIIVLILAVLKNLPVLLKKHNNSRSLMIDILMAVFDVAITSFFVFKTPIIVCIYLLINNIYSLLKIIINLLKEGKKDGERKSYSF